MENVFQFMAKAHLLVGETTVTVLERYIGFPSIEACEAAKLSLVKLSLATQGFDLISMSACTLLGGA